jgi:hypothetical protein
MKKLIAAVALLFVPLLATAEQSDALLTPDGTLYTVAFERAEDHPEVITESTSYLRLTARRGGEVTSEIIPATLTGGRNNNAMLAYDSPSGMLFVFWIQSHGLLSNQLMFASRSAEGVWGPERVFGDGFYDSRKNLRVAVTRKYRDDDGDLHAGLSVHLVWWELNTTSGRYGAKYAMASIRDGAIVDFTPLNLAEFVAPVETPAADTSQQAPSTEILSQPLLFATSVQDSVVLLFGDLETGTINQVHVTARKVIGNGRLRVPGGRREGGFRAPMMTATTNGRLEGVFVDSTRLALYTVDEGKLQYVLSDGKALSEAFAITLDEHVSPTAAVDALRRLVNEREN